MNKHKREERARREELDKGFVEKLAGLHQQRFLPVVRWDDLVTFEFTMEDGRELFVALDQISHVTSGIPDEGQLPGATRARLHLRNGDEHLVQQSYGEIVERLLMRRQQVIQSIYAIAKGEVQ